MSCSKSLALILGDANNALNDAWMGFPRGRGDNA